MSKRHSTQGAYDSKYGERTKTWTNKEGGQTKQYNVKNTKNGDHHFTNTQTGAMGTALGNYRPSRDKK